MSCWTWLFGQTRSFWVACCGMFQVIMCFPLAYLMSTYVFGVGYFNTLNVLVIYVILGVGADNVFVCAVESPPLRPLSVPAPFRDQQPAASVGQLAGSVRQLAGSVRQAAGRQIGNDFEISFPI